MIKKVLTMLLWTMCTQGAAVAKKPSADSAASIQEALQRYCNSREIDLIFFAPDQGRVYKTLIRGLIQTTSPQGSIQIAAFRFTDKDLKNDLIEAHGRGVSVEIVFDPGAMTSAYYSLALSLCEAGVAVYQYIPVGLIAPSQRSEEFLDTQRISYQAIMHHKTMLFRDTCGGGKDIVVFGSLNFTTAGFYGNEELVQVRNKPELVTAIANHFEKLKSRSYSVEPYGGLRKYQLRFVDHIRRAFARLPRVR